MDRQSSSDGKTSHQPQTSSVRWRCTSSCSFVFHRQSILRKTASVLPYNFEISAIQSSHTIHPSDAHTACTPYIINANSQSLIIVTSCVHLLTGCHPLHFYRRLPWSLKRIISICFLSNTYLSTNYTLCIRRYELDELVVSINRRTTPCNDEL